MKIKIITIHNIPNYGSAFQAMALNRYIRSLGHECKVIDYNPTYFTKGTIKARIGRLLNYRDYKERTNKYRKFVEENMTLTEKSYSSFSALKMLDNDETDLFISGGDQLWNEFYDCGRDNSYKLLFTSRRKASFGTSLGKSTFTADGLSVLADAIKDFESIGIRESSGVKLLINAGIHNIHHVCDPVFLLDKEDYDKFIHPVPLKEKYMFVYLVQQSSLLDAAVDYISDAFGLKVVLYAGFVPKCKCDVLLKNIGPEETLSYIANAEFILSSSFHATAFSTLFHKSFITLLPGENTNARIEDFLMLTGMSSKMVCDESSLEKAIEDKINWDDVDMVMREFIDESKTFLSKMLSEKEKYNND